MKFQFSLRAMMIFVTLFSITMGVFGWAWRANQSILAEEWGPNPGYVSYSTQYGGKGKSFVRDLDNAKGELEAVHEKAFEDLEKNPDFEIVGKTEKVKATISKKEKIHPGRYMNVVFISLLVCQIFGCLFLTNVIESCLVSRDERNS